MCEFGLFFLGVDDLLHFLIEVPLDILESLLILAFVVVEHLLVHGDLLGEGLFDAVAFLLDLAESVLEETVEGFRLAHLAGLLLDLLEGGGFLVEHVVGQLAGSVGQTGVCALPELFRREVLQLGGRLVSGETTVEQVVHL